MQVRSRYKTTVTFWTVFVTAPYAVSPFKTEWLFFYNGLVKDVAGPIAQLVEPPAHNR